MKLSVVIVSYNTSSLLVRCLSSVFTSLEKNNLSAGTEVYVVDNASTDDSVDIVRKKYPQTRLVCNKENIGFAAANNQAIRKSDSEYVLLLNSDAWVSEDTIPILLHRMSMDDTIGVLGPSVLNPDGSVQQSTGNIPTLVNITFWMLFLDDIPGMQLLCKPYHADIPKKDLEMRDVGWVTGACFLVRRTSIDKAGLLDERIFMYGEEVEWCYRIRKSGFRVAYNGATSVYHEKGGSSKDAIDAGIIQELQSLLYFFRLHRPHWQYPLLRMVLRLGAWLRIVIFGILRMYRNRRTLYAKAMETI